MKIDIVVNRTHAWGPEDLDKGLLNGSEEMVVEFSRQLACLGHDVIVACSLKGVSRKIHDVRWVHRSRYSKSKFDRKNIVLISFKDPNALRWNTYRSTFLWTADATILTPEQRQACSMLMGISRWHMTELQGLNSGFEHRIAYMCPGMLPVWFEEDPPRQEYQCLYASSHDRGLKDLLHMWPHIRKKVPEAKLIVTYNNPENQKPPDGVYYIGRLSNDAMNNLYKTSDVLLYPCTGGERFCIAALKAQYHGCIPCVVPKMALQDTVQFGVKCRKENFVKNSVNLLLDTDGKTTIRAEMLRKLRFRTWKQVAGAWEELIVDKRQPIDTGKRARS